MDTNQIEDVLTVSAILQSHALPDGANSPSLIGALIDWAEQRETKTLDAAAGLNMPVAQVTQAKAKRGKATESDDSDPRVTPDPSTDDPGF